MIVQEERLLKLTEFWYDYVSCDHHKDRDCHFYINKVWSYGRTPSYRVEHYPYMGTEVDSESTFTTYGEAVDHLLDYLEENVRSAHYVPSDWESAYHDYNWKGVVATLKKHNLFPIIYKPVC